MTLYSFEVGKPFPVPGPRNEGAVMELWDDGLVVMIQMPGSTRDERRAFKAGFKRYAYFESSTAFPVAVWVFDFAKPHGPIDCNFNAVIVKPERIANYLDQSEGIKNSVTFYLLDRTILQGIKFTGLDPDAVRLFQATIRKQLATPYSQADYSRYLDGLMKFSTAELFDLGTQFKHKGKSS